MPQQRAHRSPQPQPVYPAATGLDLTNTQVCDIMWRLSQGANKQLRSKYSSPPHIVLDHDKITPGRFRRLWWRSMAALVVGCPDRFSTRATLFSRSIFA